MIKRIIGILATVGILAVMVMVVVNHKQYRSLIASETEAVENQTDPIVSDKVVQADTLQVAPAPEVDTLQVERADSIVK